MNLSNFFNPAPSANVAPEGNAPTPEVEGNGPVEGVPAPTPVPQPGQIPENIDLDFFNTLVDTPQPQDLGTPMSVAKDILTPENMKKLVAAQNFTGQLDAETQKQLQSGNPDAIMEATERMVKNAYATSMQQMGSIIDTVLGQNQVHMQSTVNNQVADAFTTKETLQGIPGMDNPIVQSSAQMIAAQLRQKFPTASPEAIKGMTVKYYQELNAAMNPTNDPANLAPKEKGTDWSEWLGAGEPSS